MGKVVKLHVSRVIKSAEQWQKELRRQEVHPIEDIRDDVVSLIRNAGLDFVEVERRGGPMAGTISKWFYKETKRPQFQSLQRALHAVGKDFFIGDRNASK